MGKNAPPMTITPSGQIIARQTFGTHAAATAAGATAGTFNVTTGTAATTGQWTTGGSGITFADGSDMIMGSGGWYVDNPHILEGLLDGLDEDAKKELKNIFGLIKYDENSYEYTLPVIRRIYGDFKLGWNISEHNATNFSPTPEESEILIDYFRKDIEKMVFLLTKQSKETLPLLAKTYPTQDVELDFVRLYSKNYVAEALHKHNINENSDDVHDLFDRLKVIDAYPIEVFDEEDIVELGHIEFMHKWNGKIIEFDLTMLHNGNDIIEFFDSESQKNAEEMKIELNKKTLNYVLEKYDQFF